MPSMGRGRAFAALGEGLRGFGALLAQQAALSRQDEERKRERAFQERQFKAQRGDVKSEREYRETMQRADLASRGMSFSDASQRAPQVAGGMGAAIAQAAAGGMAPGAMGAAAPMAAASPRAQGVSQFDLGRGRTLDYDPNRDPQQLAAGRASEREMALRRALAEQEHGFNLEEIDRQGSWSMRAAAAARATSGSGAGGLTMGQVLSQLNEEGPLVAASVASRAIADQARNPRRDVEGTVRTTLRQQYRAAIDKGIITDATIQAWARAGLSDVMKAGGMGGRTAPTPGEKVSLMRGVVDVLGGNGADPAQVDSAYGAWENRLFGGGGAGAPAGAASAVDQQRREYDDLVRLHGAERVRRELGPRP